MAQVSTTDVTFWRQLNGTIVAQQGDEFFSIPQKSGMGEDKESQQLIANNFANACLLLSRPLKSTSRVKCKYQSTLLHFFKETYFPQNSLPTGVLLSSLPISRLVI